MVVIRLILEGMAATEAAERVASSSNMISSEKILSLLPDRYM
jgi:hypothetical protein